jgi:hypothetical protein
MGMWNLSDSYQLEVLRERYLYTDRPKPATPYRLGMYAAATSTKIDDYGKHSARWRQLFENGFTNELAGGYGSDTETRRFTQ